MSPVRSPSDRPPGARTRTPRRRRALGTAVALIAAALTPALGLAGAAPAGAAPAEAVDANCVVVGVSTTCSFTYTGALQSWTPPFDVTEATFEVIGAAGGSGSATRRAPGGAGGGVRATLQVADMGKAIINVGGKGATAPARAAGTAAATAGAPRRTAAAGAGPPTSRSEASSRTAESWSEAAVVAVGRRRSTTRDPSRPALAVQGVARRRDERTQRRSRHVRG